MTRPTTAPHSPPIDERGEKGEDQVAPEPRVLATPLNLPRSRPRSVDIHVAPGVGVKEKVTPQG